MDVGWAIYLVRAFLKDWVFAFHDGLALGLYRSIIISVSETRNNKLVDHPVA